MGRSKSNKPKRQVMPGPEPYNVQPGAVAKALEVCLLPPAAVHLLAELRVDSSRDEVATWRAKLAQYLIRDPGPRQNTGVEDSDLIRTTRTLQIFHEYTQIWVTLTKAFEFMDGLISLTDEECRDMACDIAKSQIVTLRELATGAYKLASVAVVTKNVGVMCFTLARAFANSGEQNKARVGEQYDKMGSIFSETCKMIARLLDKDQSYHQHPLGKLLLGHHGQDEKYINEQDGSNETKELQATLGDDAIHWERVRQLSSQIGEASRETGMLLDEITQEARTIAGSQRSAADVFGMPPLLDATLSITDPWIFTPEACLLLNRLSTKLPMAAWLNELKDFLTTGNKGALTTASTIEHQIMVKDEMGLVGAMIHMGEVLLKPLWEVVSHETAAEWLGTEPHPLVKLSSDTAAFQDWRGPPQAGEMNRWVRDVQDCKDRFQARFKSFIERRKDVATGHLRVVVALANILELAQKVKSDVHPLSGFYFADGDGPPVKPDEEPRPSEDDIWISKSVPRQSTVTSGVRTVTVSMRAGKLMDDSVDFDPAIEARMSMRQHDPARDSIGVDENETQTGGGTEESSWDKASPASRLAGNGGTMSLVYTTDPLLSPDRIEFSLNFELPSSPALWKHTKIYSTFKPSQAVIDHFSHFDPSRKTFHWPYKLIYICSGQSPFWGQPLIRLGMDLMLLYGVIDPTVAIVRGDPAYNGYQGEIQNVYATLLVDAEWTDLRDFCILRSQESGWNYLKYLLYAESAPEVAGIYNLAHRVQVTIINAISWLSRNRHPFSAGMLPWVGEIETGYGEVEGQAMTEAGTRSETVQSAYRMEVMNNPLLVENVGFVVPKSDGKDNPAEIPTTIDSKLSTSAQHILPKQHNADLETTAAASVIPDSEVSEVEQPSLTTSLSPRLPASSSSPTPTPTSLASQPKVKPNRPAKKSKKPKRQPFKRLAEEPSIDPRANDPKLKRDIVDVKSQGPIVGTLEDVVSRVEVKNERVETSAIGSSEVPSKQGTPERQAVGKTPIPSTEMEERQIHTPAIKFFKQPSKSEQFNTSPPTRPFVGSDGPPPPSHVSRNPSRQPSKTQGKGRIVPIIPAVPLPFGMNRQPAPNGSSATPATVSPPGGKKTGKEFRESKISWQNELEEGLTKSEMVGGSVEGVRVEVMEEVLETNPESSILAAPLRPIHGEPRSATDSPTYIPPTSTIATPISPSAGELKLGHALVETAQGPVEVLRRDLASSTLHSSIAGTIPLANETISSNKTNTVSPIYAEPSIINPTTHVPTTNTTDTPALRSSPRRLNINFFAPPSTASSPSRPPTPVGYTEKTLTREEIFRSPPVVNGTTLTALTTGIGSGTERGRKKLNPEAVEFESQRMTSGEVVGRWLMEQGSLEAGTGGGTEW